MVIWEYSVGWWNSGSTLSTSERKSAASSAPTNDPHRAADRGLGGREVARHQRLDGLEQVGAGPLPVEPLLRRHHLDQPLDGRAVRRPAERECVDSGDDRVGGEEAIPLGPPLGQEAKAVEMADDRGSVLDSRSKYRAKREAADREPCRRLGAEGLAVGQRDRRQPLRRRRRGEETGDVVLADALRMAGLVASLAVRARYPLPIEDPADGARHGGVVDGSPQVHQLVHPPDRGHRCAADAAVAPNLRRELAGQSGRQPSVLDISHAHRGPGDQRLAGVERAEVE